MYHSLYSLEGAGVGPEELGLFAILRHSDVIGGHLQSNPQLRVNDPKTAKVGVYFTIRGNLLIPDGLAIDQNTCNENWDCCGGQTSCLCCAWVDVMFVSCITATPLSIDDFQGKESNELSKIY